MAMVAATVANGGTVYKPSLIYRVQEADGSQIRRPAKVRGDLIHDNELNKDQIEMVRKGMWRVVNDQGGTGAKARVPGISVAGKTGTAQFWREGKKDNHTWFVAFAPYDKPKIALAVLVQGAKAGGQVPAPIAAKMIDEILALDRGYDPGVQPLDAAVGNFKFVDTINFKDSNVPAQYSADDDDETADEMPDPEEVPAPKLVTRHHHDNDSGDQADEPDIRPEADHHNPSQRAQTAPPEKRHNFLDFFRKKPKEDQPGQQPTPSEERKKKRFLFF